MPLALSSIFCPWNYIVSYHIKKIQKSGGGEPQKVSFRIWNCKNCRSLVHLTRPWNSKPLVFLANNLIRLFYVYLGDTFSHLPDLCFISVADAPLLTSWHLGRGAGANDGRLVAVETVWSGTVGCIWGPLIGLEVGVSRHQELFPVESRKWDQELYSCLWLAVDLNPAPG